MTEAKRFIPYSRQHIDEEDIIKVSESLRSELITQGPTVEEFENLLSEYCGTRFCVVFSSGTASLHAAYFAADVQKEDIIITSTYTFCATSNAALYHGAKVIFCDVESDTANMSVDYLEYLLKKYRSNKRIKSVVPVDFAGHPAELDEIIKLAKRYNKNIVVIEDACHALGALYNNKKVGSISDMTIFSFHPVKSITTGEGGAVVTNNKKFYEKLKIFRHHGIVKKKDWLYDVVYLGNNYRITDIQCALGISQLRKLDSFIEKRRKIAEQYRNIFSEQEFFDLPVERENVKSSYHLFPIRLKGKCKNNKRKIFRELREKGVGVQVHYIPVHLHPYYKSLGFKEGQFPVAESFYKKELSIPIFQSMSQEEIEYVSEKLFETLSKYK